MKQFLLALLAIGLLTASVFADDEHFINIMPGDRAAGLGGAYTAISDGPEGAYYNPAGLAYSPTSYFSLSTNAVQLKRLQYFDIYNGYSGLSSTNPVNYTRDSFSFVPNFFGMVQKDQGTAFALTIASLDNESFDQRDKLDLETGGVTLNVNVDYVQTTSDQEVGFSWGFLLDKHFSLGCGLFAGYKDKKYINGSVLRETVSQFFSTSTIYSREQLFTLRPSLGVQLALGDQITVGLASTMALPIFGIYTSQFVNYTYASDDPTHPSADVGDTTVRNFDIIKNNFFTGTSIKNSLGIAWFPTQSLALSGDFLAYVPIDPKNALGKVFTWNAALGLEWYISPNFPLRIGLFTNNANTPVLYTNLANQADHIDMYGASLATGYTTSNFDLTIGVSASTGAGYAQILSDGNFATPINTASASTLQVFISGGYH